MLQLATLIVLFLSDFGTLALAWCVLVLVFMNINRILVTDLDIEADAAECLIYGSQGVQDCIIDLDELNEALFNGANVEFSEDSDQCLFFELHGAEI